ncbi:acyl-CoA dehydrogenase family protein [Streptomyces kebangsaanensis]|uniref:Acyl-CoA dehydrogenase family protein n=1 Tax=Streptomyces kebangsaanensis TaxID=864058 RepID=A0ABW6KVW2_9ACTN|nr:acyl-CoA dehydrogenase family protein [Streptomyces kebangsaanensis]
MTRALPAFSLGEEHLELRAAVRGLCEKEIAPRAAGVDANEAFPEASLRALTAARLHAVTLPERYGGEGGDHLAGVVVAEEVARACATTQQVAGSDELFALPLLLAGSEEQRQRYLPRIASGEGLGAFALSEPEAGSDVAAISTRATPTEGGWVLRGTKRWITNAGHADVYLVFAATGPKGGGKGLAAFVVEAGDPGLSFGAPERKMGMRGSPTREVYFDDVFVPADRLVGEPGEGMRIALATLDRTRATVAAQAVGIAQGALDVAVAYLTERLQFGKPLAAFQGLQFMVADMETQIRAARALTHAAARELDAHGGDITAAGAVAKCFASDMAMKVTTDAVQLLGGAGYVRDFPVERMMRDAKVTQIYEGTNQIQRLVIARSLLGAS